LDYLLRQLLGSQGTLGGLGAHNRGACGRRNRGDDCIALTILAAPVNIKGDDLVAIEAPECDHRVSSGGGVI